MLQDNYSIQQASMAFVTRKPIEIPHLAAGRTKLSLMPKTEAAAKPSAVKGIDLTDEKLFEPSRLELSKSVGKDGKASDPRDPRAQHVARANKSLFSKVARVWSKVTSTTESSPAFLVGKHPVKWAGFMSFQNMKHEDI